MFLNLFFKQTTRFEKVSGSSPTSLIPPSQDAARHDENTDVAGCLYMNFWTWAIDSWTLNYAALGLSVILLIVTFCILKVHDGGPLPDWRYSISLNTVLSILATGIKGSTILATATALSQSKWVWYYDSRRPLQDFRLFDEASRGPLGATQLLFRLRMWHLASMGSIITLLGLLSDIFVQASATTASRLRDVGEARIPVCTNYSGDWIRTSVDGVDRSIKSALYKGVLEGGSQSTASLLTPQCSSGVCSYPPYVSLGVCSKCDKVAARLTCEYIPYVEHLFEISGPPNSITLYDRIAYLTIAVGTNLTLPHAKLNMTSTPGYSPSQASNRRELPDGTVILSDTVAMMGNPGRNTLSAFQCSLYLCNKVYNGTVQNGALVKKVLKTSSDER